MNGNYALLGDDQLEAVAEQLWKASQMLRELGEYSLAARVRTIQIRLDGALLLRRSEAMVEADRQLALTPPGAYDLPAA